MKLDDVLKNIEAEAIRKKLRLVEFKNDKERGAILGLTGNSITIYRTREKKGMSIIPYERIVNMARKNKFDLNKIFEIKE